MTERLPNAEGRHYWESILVGIGVVVGLVLGIWGLAGHQWMLTLGLLIIAGSISSLFRRTGAGCAVLIVGFALALFIGIFGWAYLGIPSIR